LLTPGQIVHFAANRSPVRRFGAFCMKVLQIATTGFGPRGFVAFCRYGHRPVVDLSRQGPDAALAARGGRTKLAA
jgi:hypothetical protein